MKPTELNFGSTEKQHFFDVTNGEVFQDPHDLSEYVEARSSTSQIMYLGELLRNGMPDGAHLPYKRIDTSDWSKDTFKMFGWWLSAVVEAPHQPGQNHMNLSVIRNAETLGIGPSRKAIRTMFGRVSLFYEEIGEQDTHRVGTFSDWGIEDYVAHIKNVGGSKRPTDSELKAFSDVDRQYPKPSYITARFKEIGGLKTLYELAGYPVIDLWSNHDYIDWGVRFAEANGGKVPSARMADYLSVKKQGPSASSIRNRFDYIKLFQAQVQQAYLEHKHEKAEMEKHKLSLLEDDIKKGFVPANFFDAVKSSDAMEDNVKEAAPEMVATVCAELGINEVMRRYGMLKVVFQVLPNASLESQANTAKRSFLITGREFVASINKHNEVSRGDIEHAALTLGFFDDIWPMNQHLETLKLDSGYVDYYKKLHKVTTIRSAAVLSI